MTKTSATLLVPIILTGMLTGCAFDGKSVNIDGVDAAIYNYTSVSDPITLAPEDMATAEPQTTVTGPVQVTIDTRADQIVEGMSIDEKIGQMLMLHAETGSVPDQASAYKPGGILFFARDFENSSPDEFLQLTREISTKEKIKPFTAVDEEGGNVVRVSKYSQFREKPFPSVKDDYAEGGLEQVRQTTAEKAALLASIGINLNLAPVADTCDEGSYIYERTVGTDIENTATVIGEIVKITGQNGVASCLKHFPGYGNNVDTHTGSAHDDRALSDFYTRDFYVFGAGLSALEDCTPAVMINHNIYDTIDDTAPASLSKVMHGVLRTKMNFDGVAITDDLNMDAIQEFAGEESVYVMAVLADNDMLIVTDPETAFADIKAAYNSGKIPAEDIDKHVRRIILMKLQYGIIN